METGSSIKLFQEKTIRSTWNAEEELWYFSLVDIVEALTYSTNPRDYLKKNFVDAILNWTATWGQIVPS